MATDEVASEATGDTGETHPLSRFEITLLTVSPFGMSLAPYLSTDEIFGLRLLSRAVNTHIIEQGQSYLRHLNFSSMEEWEMQYLNWQECREKLPTAMVKVGRAKRKLRELVVNDYKFYDLFPRIYVDPLGYGNGFLESNIVTVLILDGTSISDDTIARLLLPNEDASNAETMGLSKQEMSEYPAEERNLVLFPQLRHLSIRHCRSVYPAALSRLAHRLRQYYRPRLHQKTPDLSWPRDLQPSASKSQSLLPVFQLRTFRFFGALFSPANYKEENGEWVGDLDICRHKWGYWAYYLPDYCPFIIKIVQQFERMGARTDIALHCTNAPSAVQEEIALISKDPIPIKKRKRELLLLDQQLYTYRQPEVEGGSFAERLSVSGSVQCVACFKEMKYNVEEDGDHIHGPEDGSGDACNSGDQELAVCRLEGCVCNEPHCVACEGFICKECKDTTFKRFAIDLNEQVNLNYLSDPYGGPGTGYTNWYDTRSPNQTIKFILCPTKAPPPGETPPSLADNMHLCCISCIRARYPTDTPALGICAIPSCNRYECFVCETPYFNEETRDERVKFHKCRDELCNASFCPRCKAGRERIEACCWSCRRWSCVFCRKGGFNGPGWLPSMGVFGHDITLCICGWEGKKPDSREPGYHSQGYYSE